jgi:hypothetical protein
VIAAIPEATVVTMGLGVVMIRLGLGRGLLQFRRSTRRCPSCGVLIEGSVCRRCSGGAR